MIDIVIEQRRRSLGGFEVGRLLPFTKRRMVGPFIFFDRMVPLNFSRAFRIRWMYARTPTSACPLSLICSRARSCTATASVRNSRSGLAR